MVVMIPMKMWRVERTEKEYNVGKGVDCRIVELEWWVYIIL